MQEARKDRIAFGIGPDDIPVANVDDVQGERITALETRDRRPSGDETHLDGRNLDDSDDGKTPDGEDFYTHNYEVA